MQMNEQINIRLSAEDKDMLQKIIRAKDITMSKLIRKWIRAYYRKLFETK